MNEELTEVGEHNMRCVMCKKRIKVRTWKAKKGLLKWQTIISKVFCGKNCRKRFKLLIKLNDYLEDKEKFISYIDKKISLLKLEISKLKELK